MITLYIEENNPITPASYNNFIANLQFHRLTCTCGHSGCLSVHGYYSRSLKMPEGKVSFRICRVLCSCCHHTHALLPSCIVPYSQISLPDQAAIIACHEDGKNCNSLMENNPLIDESSCRHIIRNYFRHWKQRLLSERIPVSSLPLLVRRCFADFFQQFMQIRCTPNHLFLDTT